jgi:hypothetical protein
MTMHSDAAQVLALQALAWIATDDALFPDFLAQSGASPVDLRTRAPEPAFLAAVLDFLLQEDRWILDFCASQGVPATTVQMARATLSGGDAPHWT